jgi:hypothetical protein
MSVCSAALPGRFLRRIAPAILLAVLSPLIIRAFAVFAFVNRHTVHGKKNDNVFVTFYREQDDKIPGISGKFLLSFSSQNACHITQCPMPMPGSNAYRHAPNVRVFVPKLRCIALRWAEITLDQSI